jgi:hypothetical protein
MDTRIPPADEIQRRIVACEAELRALRRLLRLADAAEAAEEARRARGAGAPQRPTGGAA